MREKYVRRIRDAAQDYLKQWEDLSRNSSEARSWRKKSFVELMDAISDLVIFEGMKEAKYAAKKGGKK